MAGLKPAGSRRPGGSARQAGRCPQMRGRAAAGMPGGLLPNRRDRGLPARRSRSVITADPTADAAVEQIMRDTGNRPLAEPVREDGLTTA